MKRFPAEWEPQGGVQLTWPDADTPWYQLEKVQECYCEIAAGILPYEPLMMVCRDVEACRSEMFRIRDRKGLDLDVEAIRFFACPVNDTWARDHGPLSVIGDEGEKYLLDFVFNGWGLKFAADLDNQITRRIYDAGAFAKDVALLDMRPYVLEGGSVDTDGAGTLLSTVECLCSLNRNEYLDRNGVEAELRERLGIKRFLWLEEGSIAGDDTDSHVDILARFAAEDAIVYTACDDPTDENYASLKAMEAQLKSFRTASGKPYRLFPLPLPDPMYLEGYRLPASYANFLILNGAVLMPGAGSPKDAVAAEVLRKAFPGREVHVVDCRPLLSGHGGLHCVTMQYPEGYFNE